MNEQELYLDTLGVLKKLLIKDSSEGVERELEKCVQNFLSKHINVLLTKEVLMEALKQDLIYLKCFESTEEVQQLNISNFKDDIFIIDIILNYVGDIPVNIYCGQNNNVAFIWSMRLKELKDLVYEYNELL